MRIEFDVRGEDVVAYELLRFSERAIDMAPGLRRVATVLRSQMSDRFDAEGPGWAPLADSTVETKARAGLDPRILHATLALRDSLTDEGGDNIEHVTSDSLIFGTSDPKAAFHQDGTSRMPARELLSERTIEMRPVIQTLQRYLVEGDLIDYRVAVGI